MQGCSKPPHRFDLPAVSCDSARSRFVALVAFSAANRCTLRRKMLQSRQTDMPTDYSNIFATMLASVQGATSRFLGAGYDQSRVLVEPPRDATHGDRSEEHTSE